MAAVATADAPHVRDVDPNELLQRHEGLVRRSASRLRSRLPACVQTEDLIQAGMMVLLEAAERYDSSQGASFETYAAIRVRGAMLDEVRNSEWAPRSVQRKARQISKAMEEVADIKEREAKDTEVAERLGISVDSFRELFREASARKVISLEEMSSQEDVLADNSDGAFGKPQDALEKARFDRDLENSIGNLPEREREVIRLYHEKGLTLREIGGLMCVSESRVAQMHSRALKRLKDRMSHWSETH
ncbi:MAG: RNA polymerase sigma factor FliA [Gammaproteobacteria bacterium]|nr:RNA polymerase sigma factor FliA [Gammaproteobacteria bacterium]